MAAFYQLTHEPPSHAGLSKRKARQSMRLSAYTEGLTGVWEEKRYSRPDRWYCVDDGKLTLHCKTLKKKMFQISKLSLLMQYMVTFFVSRRWTKRIIFILGLAQTSLWGL